MVGYLCTARQQEPGMECTTRQQGTRPASVGWRVPARALTSEACVETQPEHNRSVHVPELRTLERLRERLIDDLQVEGRAEPVGDLGIVIQLDGVLMAEAQPELLAQERDEVATDLRARPADPEVVARPPGPEPLGTDPHVVPVLDRVRRSEERRVG